MRIYERLLTYMRYDIIDDALYLDGTVANTVYRNDYLKIHEIVVWIDGRVYLSYIDNKGWERVKIYDDDYLDDRCLYDFINKINKSK